MEISTATRLQQAMFEMFNGVFSIDVINVFTFFIHVTFFTFFNVLFIFFHVFYFEKKTSNAKYEYVKIQRKIFLEDDLAMIFIDFDFLRYCKISYLLAEEQH